MSAEFYSSPLKGTLTTINFGAATALQVEPYLYVNLQSMEPAIARESRTWSTLIAFCISALTKAAAGTNYGEVTALLAAHALCAISAVAYRVPHPSYSPILTGYFISV